MRIDKVGEVVQKTQIKAATKESKPKESKKVKPQKIKAESNQPKEKVNDEKAIIALIEKANKSVKTYDRRLEYAIHEKTHEIMVKVIDTSGKDEQIIREIPSEKMLDMVARMWELAGIIVDEKA